MVLAYAYFGGACLLDLCVAMKIVAGIATFDARSSQLEQAVESLSGQVDEIIVYNNSNNKDLTDNGKFYGLIMQNEPCYYLSCDDDIIYPPDYSSNMVSAIDRLGGIVTHHGRLLTGLNKDYYRQHIAYRCFSSVGSEKRIDVAGTGVSGFRTDQFNPIEVINDTRQRMSDLLFSLEASKQNVPIFVLKHQSGWLKEIPVPKELTCFGMEFGNNEVQNGIANEIYKLNYELLTSKV